MVSGPSAVSLCFHLLCQSCFSWLWPRSASHREGIGMVATRFECGEDDMLTAQMNHFSHVIFPSPPLLILLFECIQYRRILRTYGVANCHAYITQIQHIQFSLLSWFSFFFIFRYPEAREWFHSAANVGGRISLRNWKERKYCWKAARRARRILVQMSVNSVTHGLKFRAFFPHPSPLFLCQILFFSSSTTASPYPLFFTALKDWIQYWYFVVLFHPSFTKLSVPGSRYLFTMFVKMFSAFQSTYSFAVQSKITLIIFISKCKHCL